MPEKIAITGASGFIGGHLAPALEAAGFEVQRLSSDDGDIAAPPLKIASDVAHVYHLAARSFVPDSWTDPPQFYRTNVIGTANVLEFCRRSGASVTFVSSYVYGKPQALPVAEDHPVFPTSPYSHTKIIGEALVSYYSAQFGIKAGVVRPFNVYGPGQSPPFLIPSVIEQALSPDTDVIEVADDRPARDYLYIADLVELLLRVLGLSGGPWNAGSGTSVSVARLVDMVNSLIERPKRLASRAAQRQAEVLNVVADITRAQSELGWTPTVTLMAGLRRTLESASRRRGIVSGA